MKVTSMKDGIPVRKLVTACAVNKAVLAAVAEKWDDKEGLLDSRHANIIVSWCVKHYRKYHKAPGRQLEAIHDEWGNRTQDKDLAKSVETLMVQLSDEYAHKSAVQEEEDYVIDLAGKLFKKVQLRRRNREIEAALDLGDVEKATNLAETFAPIQMGTRSWVKGTAADNSLRKALRAADLPPIVTYPGAIGQFFGNIFRVGAFVVFEGPEKRGKTRQLTDVSYRAMCQGKRVAFFAVGDMSQDEMLELFASRATGRPLVGEDTKFPYPLSMTVSGGTADVTPEVRERPTLTFGAARKFWRKFNAKMGTDDLLRISAHPNYSVSILGVLGVLKAWERRGWVPSLIVIDYLDLLLPCATGKTESREQIDETWKRARALGQVLGACVVSASQTDADSYTTEVISMKNFSGSKTKNAHVTTMIGLNQTDQEKEQGVMRYNMPARRRGKAITSSVCYAAGCPAVGNPVVLSAM